MRETMTHELTHMEDDRDGVVTDWTDPEQLARGEVRASRRSGECGWRAELRRWPVSRWPEMMAERWRTSAAASKTDADAACVRRRATASVAMGLDADADVAAYVDRVFLDARRLLPNELPRSSMCCLFIRLWRACPNGGARIGWRPGTDRWGRPKRA